MSRKHIGPQEYAAGRILNRLFQGAFTAVVMLLILPEAATSWMDPPMRPVHVTRMNSGHIQSQCLNLRRSPNLTMFVDPLPIPPVIHFSSLNGTEVVIGAYKIKQKMHRDLPRTTLYAYGTSASTASYPGPTLEAMKNVVTSIKWQNHLHDRHHMLAMDGTLSAPKPKLGGVPIVTHLHGMEVESTFDGQPEAWFTAKRDVGPEYVTRKYFYHNSLSSSMLWYHDHTVGMTRLNNAAGLTGAYIVREDSDPQTLPSGKREIVLSLRDYSFFSNGSINFPTVGQEPDIHPSWCLFYSGDTITVNGKVWPYLEVFAAKYRFRILNAAIDRFFNLSLSNDNLTFVKIGSDGGFLHKPVYVKNITLSPAERADVIIDFTGLAGTLVHLNNSAPIPYPSSATSSLEDVSGAATVLQFRVLQNTTADNTMIPPKFKYIKANLHEKDVTRRRRFVIQSVESNKGDNITITVQISNSTWKDKPTEFPSYGSTEVWEFVNLQDGIGHPIHLHLVRFHVLNLQPLNVSLFEGQNCSLDVAYGHSSSCYSAAPTSPGVDQFGWKDTATAMPGNVTRILVKWTSQDGTPFPFDPTVGPGYVWHCHMLNHEDNDMMRPLIMRNNSTQTLDTVSRNVHPRT